MTTVATVKREVKELKQKLVFKPQDTVIVRLWLPDSDPRVKMTDEEIVAAHKNSDNRILVLPMREKP